jgi:methyltransferase (TIGR00027 family)
VIHDPLAERLLTPWRRMAALALRRWPLTEYGRSATFSFLGARTRFFDDAVTAAITAGIGQVVIIGAGYDARAWRLADPRARWFEVDHPATQRDKRRRAPAGDVTYVPCDLQHDDLKEVLVGAGFAPDQPAVFIVEGLTMYLAEPETERLFVTLGRLGCEGSRLAANFTGPGGGSVGLASRVVARLIRASWWLSGERMTHWGSPAAVAPLLERTGWRLVESLSGPTVAERYLAGTSMSISDVSPSSTCVSCAR